MAEPRMLKGGSGASLQKLTCKEEEKHVVMGVLEVQDKMAGRSSSTIRGCLAVSVLLKHSSLCRNMVLLALSYRMLTLFRQSGENS